MQKCSAEFARAHHNSSPNFLGTHAALGNSRRGAIATLSQAPDTNTGYYENGCPGGPLRRRVLRRPGVPLGGRVPLSPGGGAAAPPSRGTPPAEVLRRPGVPPGAPSGGGSSGVRGSLYRPPAQIPRRVFQARMPPLINIGVDFGVPSKIWPNIWRSPIDSAEFFGRTEIFGRV